MPELNGLGAARQILKRNPERCIAQIPQYERAENLSGTVSVVNFSSMATAQDIRSRGRFMKAESVQVKT
jgi:hypothetical protein